LAKKRKAQTAGILGFDGGRLKNMVDLKIIVPSNQYGVIEDMHMAIGHILTFYLKQR
jgi:D-sedoheptulose 7-phosphate isomerase